jgi:hypothetical protein
MEIKVKKDEKRKRWEGIKREPQTGGRNMKQKNEVAQPIFNAADLIRVRDGIRAGIAAAINPSQEENEQIEITVPGFPGDKTGGAE